MRVRILALLVLWGVGASADLLACGNKFLVPSRGTRFGKAPIARETASILVYARPGSALSEPLAGVPVAAVLTDAGYRPTVVSEPKELQLALDRGSWDLVLADLADGQGLPQASQQIAELHVLPVLFEPSRRELAKAKRDFGLAMKAPFKSRQLLAVVDFAVALVGR